MRMNGLALTLLFLLSVPGAARGEVKPPYDAVLFESNVMIPMRDGVRLAADIYRPAKNGKLVEDKLPVLVHRTPYDKSGSSRVSSAEFYAQHGYVVVVQDLRGRYASEGEFTKYIGEGQDGYDTIEFLAELPYTNGKVGMWGTSYAAHVQANAAKLKPPHLETITVNMGGLYSGWDHKIRNHGAFELQQLTWAFRQLAAETEDPVVREMLEQEDVRDWLAALPLRKGLNPLSVAPNFEDYILTMMTHGDYDEYWQHLDINWSEYFDQTADIPILLVSGWYDSYCGGTTKNYVGLQKHLSAPVHLLMGPWTHSGNTRSYAGDVEFGPEAAITDFHREFHLRWMDRFLKGKEEDPETQPVRIFVMGTGDGHKDSNGRLYHGGYWRSETTWPVPETKFQNLYFHPDGTLRTEPPKEDLPPTTYTYDPADPVPTMGGSFSSTSPVFEPGAYHQAERNDFYGCTFPYLPLKARRDVVVFQTEILEEAIEVIGPIEVELYVSSTATDTDFTAKLIDVYPPSSDFPSGFEMNLTDGILRARYRNSPATQELLQPGEIYQITIEPFPTANVFKKGHRIRIDISSSNFPRFDINPNTGEPLGRHRNLAPADNSIYHDNLRPSHLVLPVIPNH
jgi:putative CocE/NonD family hydrolase